MKKVVDNTQRNIDITLAVMRGKQSMPEIGKKYKISHTAIRKIINSTMKLSIGMKQSGFLDTRLTVILPDLNFWIKKVEDYANEQYQKK